MSFEVAFHRCLFSIMVSAMVTLFAEASHAGTVSRIYEFEETDGTHAATADFQLEQSDVTDDVLLTLVLTNNSKASTHSATDVLLGLFFNITGMLAPVSAELTMGSTVISDSAESIDPGAGWEVRTGINHAGYNAGVAGAGYGIFGPNGNLGTSKAPQPAPSVKLDGSDYGLVGVNHSKTMANGSVKMPLFENRLRFTFSVTKGFNLSDLGNSVRFQYGTSLDEPSFDVDPPPSAPEPSTLVLILIAGFVAVGRIVWHKALSPHFSGLTTVKPRSH
jgi:hypothetical protein